LPYGLPVHAPTAAPPPPPHPALEELPPRTGAPGDTKGTIACGGGRCFAPSEVCTWVVQAAAWGCVPAAEITPSTVVDYACDDSSDCQDGKRCCRTFDRGVDHVRCAVPEEQCSAHVCSGEGGAPCPAGQSCRNGQCTPDKPPPATCDGKKPCPADKPICFWRDTEGECVSEEKGKEIASTRADEAGISLRRCTRPADCAPGLMCCGDIDDGLWMSTCAPKCAGFPKLDYCETDADCGTDGTPLHCAKARGVGQAEMPPWSKRCGADEVPVPAPVPTPEPPPVK
jgi:hypothetical protein